MTDPWVLLPLSKDEASATSVALIWIVNDETSSEWEVKAAQATFRRLEALREAANRTCRASLTSASAASSAATTSSSGSSTPGRGGATQPLCRPRRWRPQPPMPSPTSGTASRRRG